MLRKLLSIASLALAMPAVLSAQDKVIGFEEFQLDANTNLLMFNEETLDDGDTLIISYDQDEEIKVSLEAFIEWGMLSGFEISNATDETFIDYSTPLAVQPLEGANGTAHYAVAFVLIDFMGDDPTATIPVAATFENIPEDYTLDHFYVTNQTIAYNYMTSGYNSNNEYYMDLVIRAYNEEDFIDSVVVSLGDFRDGNDFVMEDWTLVDVSHLEGITSLTFDLESNDAGEWGINTPMYFGLDEITFVEVEEDDNGISVDEITQNALRIYPNPAKDVIYFSETVENFSLINSIGQVVITTEQTKQINVSELATGVYYMLFTMQNGQVVKQAIQVL